MGWCFYVEKFVETFKDVAKVEHLWKKRETILENLLHNKIFSFCQRKKNNPFFFLKICVKYTLSKKQKVLFWKLLVQKASVNSFSCLQKEKEKQSLYLQSFDLNDKNSAHFVWGKVLPVAKNKILKKRSAFSFCLFQSCLLLQVSKMGEAKNKQTRSEVFFSICQGNNTVVQDNKTSKPNERWCRILLEKKQHFPPPPCDPPLFLGKKCFWGFSEKFSKFFFNEIDCKKFSNFFYNEVSSKKFFNSLKMTTQNFRNFFQ